jgi:hypothetical protein
VTSHQLAKALLTGPDLPVYYSDDETMCEVRGICLNSPEKCLWNESIDSEFISLNEGPLRFAANETPPIEIIDLRERI